MKLILCSFGFALGCCFDAFAGGSGHTAETAVKQQSENAQIEALHNRADQIVKKCVAKVALIREERVCESKKSAIVACLVEEVKNKDIDRAHQICERNYIL